MRAVHGPLAVPAYHPGVGVLGKGLGPVFGQVFVVGVNLRRVLSRFKYSCKLRRDVT